MGQYTICVAAKRENKLLLFDRYFYTLVIHYFTTEGIIKKEKIYVLGA